MWALPAQPPCHTSSPLKVMLLGQLLSLVHSQIQVILLHQLLGQAHGPLLLPLHLRSHS